MKQREFEKAFMTVVPLSANHIMIKGRDNNYIDITTDMTACDQIFLITRSGSYTVDDEGNIRKTPERAP